MSDAKILDLRRVDFTPAPEAIPLANLREIAATYEGKKVSMRDLYKMLAAIDALYDKAGIIARAILPVQDIKDGIVTVQIVEARIGQLTTKNGRRLRDSYLRKTLDITPNSILAIAPLEQTLIRYNTAHQSKLQVDLHPGAALGQTDININVTEPQLLHAAAYLDNSGRESTGRLRGGINASLNSALGLDETISLAADYSEGSTGIHAALRAPITPWATFATISYDWSRFDITGTRIQNLDIEGGSHALAIALDQLLIARLNWTLRANARLSFTDSHTDFATFTLFSEQLRVSTLGLSYSSQNEKGFWEISAAANHAEEHNALGRSFTYANGSFLHVRWLNPLYTLVARAGWQIGQDEMFSSQQYQIGGVATVRGFEEGILYGESGYNLSLELRRPLHRTKLTGLEALAFIDNGAVYSTTISTTRRHNQLTSIGLGANLSYGKYLSARISYGYPIKDLSDMSDLDTPRNGRLHFAIQAAF